MLTVAVALSLACMSFLVYDQIVSREFLKDDLGILADMIGSNSTAALSFGDERAAQELLKRFESETSTLSLHFSIQRADNRLPPTSAMRRPMRQQRPRREGDRIWLEDDRLRLFRTIRLDGEIAGTSIPGIRL